MLIVFPSNLINKTGQTGNDGTTDAEIMVPLKYLSNFWRVFEMSLTNCEINLKLTWSANCVLVSGILANHMSTFTITDQNFMFQL